MKNIFITALAVAGTLGAAGAELTINGAGASFPAPVYQNWTYTYSRSNPSVRVNYQSIGSGAGINQIKDKTVDFAGSDNPLTKEELDQAGLIQFPMLTGGVVVVANLRGVEPNSLKLDQPTLAGIFLGPPMETRAHDPGPGLWLAPALLVAIVIASGLMPMAVFGPFVEAAASATTGTPVHAHIALWHGLASPALWMSLAALGGGKRHR